MSNSGRRDAQGLIEYTLILILAVVVVVTAVVVFGNRTAETLGNSSNAWSNAT